MDGIIKQAAMLNADLRGRQPMCRSQPRSQPQSHTTSLYLCRTSLCLTDRWEDWEEQLGVQVVPTTTSFMDAWDGDDTLVYEPESTAAFILSEWEGAWTGCGIAQCDHDGDQ